MKRQRDGGVEPGPLQPSDDRHTVGFVSEMGDFRYHLTVLPTRQGDGDDDEPTRGHGSHRVDDGWELVRSHMTKDEVSTLLLYRKPA